MSGSPSVRSIVVLACGLLAAFGCSGADTSQSQTGSLSLGLVLAGSVQIDEVDWQITGNDMDMSGTIDVSAPGSTASVEVFGLPPGPAPYLVELTAMSVDGEVTCGGSAEFDVEVGVSTDVMVILNCKLPQELGGVRVNGKFNICAELTKMVVSPLQTSVGNQISLSSTAQDEEGDPITTMWSSQSGTIANPMAQDTTYTCTEVGDDEITVLVTDDDGTYCMSMWKVPVTCVAGEGDLCEGVTCDDTGNECTTAACNPATGECEVSNVDDGTACDGGAGSCMGGECVASDLCEGVTCDDTGNECTTAACNPANGECEVSNVDDGTSCDGGAGSCMGGECVAGNLCEGVTCDDTGNECTTAACNPANGECEVSNVDDGTSCDGGAGSCMGGECVAGNLCEGVTCDDTGNECTTAACNPANGECEVSNVDDGTSCGTAGACLDGVCVEGDPCENVVCDDTGNDCTVGICNSQTGFCEVVNVPADAACDQDGGTVCNGNGSCVECNIDEQCASNETCVLGDCLAAAEPCSESQVVTVACTNSVTTAQSPFPWTLTVSTDPIIAGGTFDATFDGIGIFPEFFLDAAQGVVNGGVQEAILEAFVATVQVRSGATGPDVVLNADLDALDPGPTRFCNFPFNTVCTADSECLGGTCFPPVNLATIPTSSDCSAGGVCDMLGKLASQCPNGFCVTGDLVVELGESAPQAYTADENVGGEVLFGWADQNVPGLFLCPAPAPNCQAAFMPDGCYDIPTVTYSAPAAPIGIRVNVNNALFVPLQCAMAEEGGICASGEGCLVDADCVTAPCTLTTDVACPTPDADLISCPIY